MLPSAKQIILLTQLFTTLAEAAEAYLQSKDLATPVTLGLPSKPMARNQVFLVLQEYGIDPLLHNQLPSFPPLTDEAPNYARLISFYLLPAGSQYIRRLQVLEALAEFFEGNPFYQITHEDREIELAISMKSVSTEAFNQFWIACRDTPQPVVFYQARIAAR